MTSAFDGATPSHVEHVLVPLPRPRRRGVASPRQAACTSNAGARPPVRWTRGRTPEAGGPHRGIGLLIAGLALLMVVEGARDHRAEEAALSRRSMDGTIAGIDPRVARGA